MRGENRDPRKRGRPAKRGEHRPYSLRLPSELHQQLKHYVVDHPQSLNDLIVKAVEQWWSSVTDRHKYVRLAQLRPSRNVKIDRSMSWSIFQSLHSC